MASKTDRMIKQFSSKPEPQLSDSVELPNYSAVAGAERVNAKVNNLKVETATASKVVVTDADKKLISGTNTNAEISTAYTHSQDNTQAHSDYLLNSGADEAVGPLTTTADNSTADQAYVPMVLYNTDATPPAASGFPIGTIYIQYTA